MRTVSRRLPQDQQRGGSVASCDLCGVLWYRSKLTRGRDGLLRCPDDAEQDPVALTEANALAASRPRRVKGETHAMDTLDGTTITSVHYTRASDWP